MEWGKQNEKLEFVDVDSRSEPGGPNGVTIPAAAKARIACRRLPTNSNLKNI